MRLTRCVGLLFIVIVSAEGALAAEAAVPPPDSVVRQLYETKIASGAEHAFDATEQIVDGHFTPELKTLYRKATSSPEPVIDFDIFYDAQDFSISDLDVTLLDRKGDTAVVRVAFNNFGEPTTLDLDMAFVEGAWKIADVHYANGYALRQIIAELP